jgi:opacity protein-like surface antigen
MKRTVLVVALMAGALASQQAAADSDLGFKRLGAAVGYVSPEHLDGTIGFGVFADMGTISPRIGMETHIDYWSQSEEAFGAEVSISDLAFGARGKYLFETSSTKIQPFLGAGLGLHFISAAASINVPGFPTMSSEDSETRLGLDLGGGMATHLSPSTDLNAEMWYGLVEDVSQLSIRMGLSFKLGS